MNTINTYYQDYKSLKNFILDNHDILFAADNRSILVQVFSGNYDRKFLISLSRQIYEQIPQAQVIGTTTSGEIMNGAVSGLKTVLSFSVFRQSDIKIAFTAQKECDSFDLGRSIAAALSNKRAKLLILFSTGSTIDPSKLLDGVRFVNPDLPVVGGVSGNNYFNKEGYVFCRDGVTDCGVVGAVLESERLLTGQYQHFCWIPIGKEMTITRAVGLRVYTIDQLPAYQIFKKYLGVDNKSDIIINSIFPLIVNRHGTEIASAPMFVHDDDSIDFSSYMNEGEKARFSFGSVEMIIKAVGQLVGKLEKRQIESIFVYSCASRRGFLQESSEIETLPLQKIAPTAGFFSNGEFFHAEHSNQLLHATMTTVALSEADKAEKTFIRESKKSVFQEKNSAALPVARDNVKSSNIAILQALTNLISSVSKELIERTNELEKVNEKTLYSSRHDPLTGVYNRGFYEQTMEQLKSCHAPLGIVMCDVDGLKFINDSLGHSAGDTILKATANIAKSILGENDLVARIGGDEFSILFKDCSSLNIQNSLQKIRQAVAGYNKANPSIPLSISFGYSTCEDSFGKTDILLKRADDNMYREKLHRRRSIRSDLVQTLIQTLQARDIITESHSKRIQGLLTRFSEYLGLSPSKISDLRLFARFHDIGKVGIPDHILFKKGPLTPQERTEMQRHCEIGYRIAQSSTDLHPIAEWILKHHEWWNGKGYPFGLSGEYIPFECRILAIIDSYDAMTGDRPYRKAIGSEAAIDELKRCAGTQFDPILAEKFIACMESTCKKGNCHNAKKEEAAR